MISLEPTRKVATSTNDTTALEIGIGRLEVIHAFLRRLDSQQSQDKVLFIAGGAGVGKSVLLRFLHDRCCNSSYLEQLEQAVNASAEAQGALFKRLEKSGDLPRAFLDFSLASRKDDRPRDPFFALLSLRHTLAKYDLPFAVFDYACIVYLYKTGQLSRERVRSLFPISVRGFAYALADLVAQSPWHEHRSAMCSIARTQLGDRFTTYALQRNLDMTLFESVQRREAMVDLIDELPALFAADLKAAVVTGTGTQQAVLFFDHYEALTANLNGCSVRRDRWFQELLRHFMAAPGIVTVVAGRKAPRWDRPATDDGRAVVFAFEQHRLEPLSKNQASEILARRGIDDPKLQKFFISCSRARSDRVMPAHLGLCLDIMRFASVDNKTIGITREQIDSKTPNAAERKKVLLKELLSRLDKDAAFALIVLCAARSFAASVYIHLAGVFDFVLSETRFSMITTLSFVQMESRAAASSFQMQEDIRQLLQKYRPRVVFKAHQILERFFREHAKTGDDTMTAAAIYHLNCRRWEKGVREWIETFRAAIRQQRYNLARALLDVLPHLVVESDFWRGKILLAIGDFYASLGQPREARQSYNDAIVVFDQAVANNADDSNSLHQKGVGLLRLAKLCAQGDNAKAALGYFSRALEVFEQILANNPDHPATGVNIGSLLNARGQFYFRRADYGKAEDSLHDALTQFDAVLSRDATSAPAHAGRAEALASLAAVKIAGAKYDDAAACFHQALSACDHAVLNSADLAQSLQQKAKTAMGFAGLLQMLARTPEAEQYYTAARGAYAEAIRHRHDDLDAYNGEAWAWAKLGEMQAKQAQKEQAIHSFERALAACATVLAASPENSAALEIRANVSLCRGEMANVEFDLAHAKKHFCQALADYEVILWLAPARISARCNLGVAHFRLGLLEDAQAKSESARNHFDKAIAILGSAAQTERVAGLGQANLILVRILAREQCDPSDANGDAARQLEASAAAAGRAGQNGQVLVPATVAKIAALERLAEACWQASAYDPAITWFSTAIADCDGLLQRGQASDVVLALKGETLSRFAALQAELAQHPQALAHFDQAVAAFDMAIRKQPLDIHLRLARAQALRRLAVQQTRMAQYQSATISYEKTLGVLDEILALVADNRDARLGKALTLINRGQLSARLSRVAEAMDSFQQALALLDGLLDSAATEAYVLNNKGIALLEIGALQQASSQATEAIDTTRQAISTFEAGLAELPNEMILQANYLTGLIALAGLLNRCSQSALATEHLDKAMQRLAELLQLAPKAISLLNLQGLALAQLGDTQAASSQFDNAIEQYTQACEVFTTALALSAHDAQLCINLGNTHYKKGMVFLKLDQNDTAIASYDNAAKIYKDVLQTVGMDVQILYNLGLVAFASAQICVQRSSFAEAQVNYEEAIAAFEKAQQNGLELPEVFSKKGDSCLDMAQLLAWRGDRKAASQSYARAIIAYEEVLSNSPDHSSALYYSGFAFWQLGEQQANLSQHGLAIGNYRHAIASFTQMLHGQPEHKDCRKNLGEAYASLAALHMRLSQQAEAIKYYKQAIATFEIALTSRADEVSLHYCKACALARLGDSLRAKSQNKTALTTYRQAVAAFDVVVQLAPDLAGVYLDKGATFLSLGNLYALYARPREAMRCYAEAATAYKRNLVIAPENHLALLGKGLTIASLGEVLHGMARHAEAMESYKHAIRAYRDLLAVFPDETAAYYHQGNAYVALGGIQAELSQIDAAIDSYGQAILAFEQVTRCEHDHFQAYFQKGLALMRLGELKRQIDQSGDARKYFELAGAQLNTARKLSPYDPQLREAIAAVRRLLGDGSNGS